MTLRGKLGANVFITVVGILLIGIASLMALYQVKEKIWDVTDNSTPYQLKTLELTKTLQEHVTLLFAAMGASTEEELRNKEEDLQITLQKLQLLVPEIQSLTRGKGSLLGHRVVEIKDITNQVIERTYEKVRAENRTAKSVAEAKALLQLHEEKRKALGQSLKKLQGTTTENLIHSTTKAKAMIEQFRELQRIKDLFPQLQKAFLEVKPATQQHEIALLQGHITFALEGIIKAARATTTLIEPFDAFKNVVLGSDGLLALKAALLSGPANTSKQDLFEKSWQMCLNQIEHLRRIVDEHVDTMMAGFYYENNQLDHQLTSSEATTMVALLNTEMAAIIDSIEHEVDSLIGEYSRERIEGMRVTMAGLFSNAEGLSSQIYTTLKSRGGEDEQILLQKASDNLNRVQQLLMRDHGLIWTLKETAVTRERSRELADQLQKVVEAQKKSGDQSILLARDEQQRSVSLVNNVVRAANVFLPAIIVFVFGTTMLLSGGIAKSIMHLVKDIEHTKEAAEAANRAKSQFLANMSHEIRTPMNGVLGLLELLQTGDLRSKQRTYVNMALSSSVALLNVINDILDFSKMEAGRMELVIEDFDLVQSVEEAVNLFAEQTETKKIELFCHIRPDIPKLVKGDVTRLRQVLINLISNAVKFTENGEIVVRVSGEKQTDEGDLLRFEVSDTGIGIAPDVQAKIFESFSQADASTTRKFGGTGLGLSIAKQLVQMMGGEIGLTSEKGKGSTFWFTAWFEQGVPSPENETDGPLEYYSRLQGLKVIIVDDNTTNLIILEDMLSAWGLFPERATDGASALTMLNAACASGQPFQLAVVDMQMPGMDGLELARAIRREGALSGLPIIMITSLDGSEELRLSRDAGISTTLIKPVRQSQVLNAIAPAMGIGTIAQTGPIEKTTGKPSSVFSVLLVEDNPVNQEVCKAMLEHLGHNVEVAGNGRIAVDRVAGKSYDIVLMDCQMPEMDGYEATKAIRHHEQNRSGDPRHIPIVALTAHALQDDAERSLAAGMDDHLSKPFTIEQLRETILKNAPVNGNAHHHEPVRHQVDHIELASSRPEESASGFDPAALDRIQALDTPGSTELIKTVISHYVNETPRILESLKGAVEGNDASAINRLAHSLKSSSANVGAMALSEFCKEMELAGRANTLDSCSGLFIQIEREYQHASKILAEAM